MAEPQRRHSRPFRWDQKKTKAAYLAAKGRTYTSICEELGIADSTFSQWLTNPDFKARITGIVDRYAKELYDKGLYEQANRIGAKNARWRAIQEIVEARAKDPELQKVPGGITGWITWHYNASGIKYGVVDVPLMREASALEMDTAKELGQIARKRITFATMLASVRARAKENGINPDDAEQEVIMLAQQIEYMDASESDEMGFQPPRDLLPGGDAD